MDKSKRISTPNKIIVGAALFVSSLFISTQNGGFNILAFAFALVLASLPHIDNVYVYTLIPVSAFGINSVLFGDPVSSLAVFIPFIFPLMLKMIKNGKIKRQTGLFISSFASTAVAVVMCAYKMHKVGGFTFESYRNVLPDISLKIEEFLVSSTEITIAGSKVAHSVSSLSGDTNVILALLPGIIFFIFYAVYKIISDISGSKTVFDGESEFKTSIWDIKISVTTSIIALISLVALIVISNMPIFIALCLFFLILSPQLFFEGLTSSFETKRVKNMIIRPIIRPTIIIMSAFLSPIYFYVVSFVFGCTDSFKNKIDTFLKDKIDFEDLDDFDDFDDYDDTDGD